MGDRYVCRRASRQADATKSRKKRKLNANQSSTAAFRLNDRFRPNFSEPEGMRDETTTNS